MMSPSLCDLSIIHPEVMFCFQQDHDVVSIVKAFYINNYSGFIPSEMNLHMF